MARDVNTIVAVFVGAEATKCLGLAKQTEVIELRVVGLNRPTWSTTSRCGTDNLGVTRQHGVLGFGRVKRRNSFKFEAGLFALVSTPSPLPKKTAASPS